MATKTITHITDDLDGVSDAETVKFGLWGTAYEIDLSPDNQEKLEAALQPFVAAARKGEGSLARRPTATRSTSSSAPSYDAKAVRVWAAANGITVPVRGRIPGSVIEQYQAAGH